MQLKLGDVSRIKIKNHDDLVPKTVGVIYGDTLKLAIHALVGQRNCFFKGIFLKIAPMSVNINFYNYYFLETAVKIIMLSLAEKRIQKSLVAF